LKTLGTGSFTKPDNGGRFFVLKCGLARRADGRKTVSTMSKQPTTRLQVLMSCRTAWFVFALVASLLAGCSKSNSVQVISAVYGSGGNFADVSDRVGELVRQPSGFQAQPSWLNTDPAPGWNKTLVIVYEAKGRRHILTAGEGDWVNAKLLLEAAR
jgi:hypothetical protein